MAAGDDALQIASDTFANPLFRNGADPWMHYYQGNYYLTTTTWASELVMRKSPTIAGLADAPAHNIWTGDDPSRCCNFWAFEFFPFETEQGIRWYVIYTAGVEGNSYHEQKNHILESEGSDPMGPYQYKDTPMKGHWNIDGSYFQHNDELYFLWSEWHGEDQVNLISKMTNPWTLEGERVVITKPEHDWETSGLRVNEGPEIIKHNGRTFLVHSASFCNTPDYKLAVVELTGDNPLKAESWTKYSEPFFSKGNGVYGPGHHGFFTSPDGSEEWLIYHGNSSPTDGCSGTRSARAQPFSWHSEGAKQGLPNFGEPMPDKQQLPVPSGEQGPLFADVQGVKYQIVNKNANLCLLANNEGGVSIDSCAASASQWVIDPANDGLYRIANAEFGSFLTEQNCSAGTANGMAAEAWQSSRCQRFSIDASRDGWFSVSNEHSINYLQVDSCASTQGSSVVTGEKRVENCSEWRIEPVSSLAVVNAHSGKVISAEMCSAQQQTNVMQQAYTDSACQKWQVQATDNGYYRFHLANNAQQCLAIETGEQVAVAGNLVVSSCAADFTQWRIEFLPQGTVRLVNRQGGALTIDNKKLIDNGANAFDQVWKDTIDQHFYLRVAN
ncbi:alpha-N-arabinofuranosidase [Thalassotalea mangrovi]|uniref:Alpha-N-arabinofuranosidase n=2 Tax=Thalassotalea mangrovi TaxID=2572245 RepID=A0A4U1B2U1_9GAMM|nr:alpha-N-arabinofuranosidase [Thalassotalea mangrovi]